MTELWLFIIVGALAVTAAVLMLLSENAVHSALFLIVTMVCIAFLFLMLNSPFLAMIQITVYAGAIMVLFLFVIMLLGAEKVQVADPGPEKHRFRWFTPVALSLALALLFSIGLVTIQGNLDADPIPQPDPFVRAVNSANDGPIDVYVGSLLVADDLRFGEASSFVSLPAGDYTVSVRPASGGETTTDLSAQPGSATNVLAFGPQADMSVSLVPQDLNSVLPDGSARVLIFNAYPHTETISVVESRSLDTNVYEYISTIAESVPYGQSVTTEQQAGDLYWRFLPGVNSADSLAELQGYALKADRTNLIVLAEEAGSVGPRTIPVVIEAMAQAVFGSPRSIGFALFTDFLLPFQLLGLLLLASMVGVIALTHRELKPIKRVQARRKVSRPMADVISTQVGQEVEVVDDAPQLPEPERPAQPEPAN